MNILAKIGLKHRGRHAHLVGQLQVFIVGQSGHGRHVIDIGLCAVLRMQGNGNLPLVYQFVDQAVLVTNMAECTGAARALAITTTGYTLVDSGKALDTLLAFLGTGLKNTIL